MDSATNEIPNWVIVSIFALLSGIVLLIFFTRLLKKKHTQLAQIMEEGWSFYSKPTTIEPPGTIFRIDKSRRKFLVHVIEQELYSGKEVSGVTVMETAMGIGILAMISGFRGVSLKNKVSVNKTTQLKFELKNVTREATTDEGITRSAGEYIRNMPYLPDNKYYIIREARKATEIKYILGEGLAAELGGEAILTESMRLNGDMFKVNKKNGFELIGAFSEPLRIMFLPEELKPTSFGLSGDNSIEFGRVPVKEKLVWIEEYPI